MTEENHLKPKFTVELIKSHLKSKAWQYFGVLKTNDILTDSSHYYCKICIEEKGFLTPK